MNFGNGAPIGIEPTLLAEPDFDSAASIAAEQAVSLEIAQCQCKHMPCVLLTGGQNIRVSRLRNPQHINHLAFRGTLVAPPWHRQNPRNFLA